MLLYRVALDRLYICLTGMLGLASVSRPNSSGNGLGLGLRFLGLGLGLSLDYLTSPSS